MPHSKVIGDLGKHVQFGAFTYPTIHKTVQSIKGGWIVWHTPLIHNELRSEQLIYWLQDWAHVQFGPCKYPIMQRTVQTCMGGVIKTHYPFKHTELGSLQGRAVLQIDF